MEPGAWEGHATRMPRHARPPSLDTATVSISQPRNAGEEPLFLPATTMQLAHLRGFKLLQLRDGDAQVVQRKHLRVE